MHKHCKQAVTKYLEQHAESTSLEIAQSLHLPRKRYVLVIPAYDESHDFILTLSEHIDAIKLLLIVVVNEPIGQTQNQNNQKLISWLCNKSSDVMQHTGGITGAFGKLTFILLDHTHERSLSPKYGVGLARKLGADLATALIYKGIVERPWIYSTDADSQLPSNYFSDGHTPDNTCSALTFQFKHRGEDNAVTFATTLYEEQLHFYQKQLKQAGSPYAFCSLGSCMAVSMIHYCQVRGFPKRPAGEDFYLLNKLAKVGKLVEVENVTIEIEARLSQRVPFGTGPAVSTIMNTLEQGLTPKYYHPSIFAELKHVLASIDGLWGDHEASLQQLHSSTLDALESAGIRDFLYKRLTQDKSITQFRKHFHEWFDAFRTLKFIHRLQASRFPAVALSSQKA